MVITLHHIAAGILENLSGCAGPSTKYISDEAITSSAPITETIASSSFFLAAITEASACSPGQYRAIRAVRLTSRKARNAPKSNPVSGAIRTMK